MAEKLGGSVDKDLLALGVVEERLRQGRILRRLLFRDGVRPVIGPGTASSYGGPATETFSPSDSITRTLPRSGRFFNATIFASLTPPRYPARPISPPGSQSDTR
ncbi:hypothetical protein [Pseudooceanicola sp. HF7]|uniref:hypothetical protein n=1 Tax=Pseudooceanicola sp. HF7 TaxID=2721560 RepID=UPI00142FF5B0|nr:hypothetical protein [Pseudooceanicola sp. HF7]NIZ10050.1 hypothetical protein [Pseudooceanicola sp. HF7]